MKLEIALQLAGLAQIGLIIAGALMPGAVKLREHLRPLPPFIRRLFWVYFIFIGFSLFSFGMISWFFAADLPVLPVGRAFCAFLAVFWTIRLVVASWVFDVRPYLTNAVYRVGYQATNVVFAFLPLIFGWAAFKGGGR